MGKFIDLTGQTFGKLTVISRAENVIRSSKPAIMWECVCECGNTKNIQSQSLREGKTKSCGCIRHKDISGQVFGYLTAIKYIGIKNKNPLWLCDCPCGNSINATSNHLRSGDTKSCGCYKSEVHGTHGMCNTPEYNTWDGMKQRCSNPNHESFNHYGGRGIKVCDEWVNSFENFIIDMGKKPSANHSIERINNNENYHPSNCKWATHLEQSINKRTSKPIVYNGNPTTINQLSRDTGIAYSTLNHRIRKMAMSPDESVAKH